MGRKSRRQIVYLPQDSGNPLSARDLGGKGAGLVAMVREGVPVPPVFTVRTTVARAYAENERLPDRIGWQMKRGIRSLERATGRFFGSVRKPLLVSVRSGAQVSMPGMMDTVLNLGLNPDTVQGLIKLTNDERFAYDCYRRFLAQFATVVLGMETEKFDKALAEALQRNKVDDQRQLSAASQLAMCGHYRSLIEEYLGEDMIDDAYEQLVLALVAVCKSWNSDRAQTYRREHQLPDWWGTAVNVQTMVFGNAGDDSCTGVVFSRNVSTGEPGLYGEFLVNAQGEDVVDGKHNALPISDMADWNERLYQELQRQVAKQERRLNDVADVEFTVQKGRLWILQSRTAKRTPLAAVTIAYDMVQEGTWTKTEALASVGSEQLEALSRPRIDPDHLAEHVEDGVKVYRGLPVSFGGVAGRVVTSSQAAVKAAKNKTEPVILVLPDTTPKDLAGMIAMTGGTSCHAAVVARELNKPCVVGVKDLMVLDHQILSMDGSLGVVFGVSVQMIEPAKTKATAVFKSWVHHAERKLQLVNPVARLNFDLVTGDSLNVSTAINDFYLAGAMEVAARGTALHHAAVSLKQRVHHQVAEHIAMYLVVAVSGELRHLFDKGLDGYRSVQEKAEQLANKFGVHRSGSNRPGAQMDAVSRLKGLSPQDHVQYLQLAVEVFDNPDVHWRGSNIGGQKWARIAEAALHYLTGKLNATAFADHAFDLKHNGGLVFNKHSMVAAYPNTVYRQLDAKKMARGVHEMIRALENTGHRTFSEQVLTVSHRGERMGIWQAEARRFGIAA